MALLLDRDPSFGATEVRDSILSMATKGQLSGLQGSPDKLAFTPQVLDADITGPASPDTGTVEWDSNPDGGDFEYGFLWEERYEYAWGPGDWNTVATTRRYERTVHQWEPDFTIRVTVTTSLQEAVRSRYIHSPCGEYGMCPESTTTEPGDEPDDDGVDDG